MDHTIVKPHLQLLETLAAIAGHHGKKYCFPTQETIIKRHQQHTGHLMSRATLNRHLSALELRGWIGRTRRHRKGTSGSLELHSTLYQFTAKCGAYLARLWRKLKPWEKFLDWRAPRELGDNRGATALLRCLISETTLQLTAENHAAGAQKRPPASINEPLRGP